jgi:glycosyltransferase involved in cell wall biosynthesis
MIEAVKLVDNAVLCILGDGPWKGKLTELVSKENLYGKVYMCGVYSYDDLHEITCSGDIGTAFFEPVSFSYELALPNKLFEYMLAGKPVIASDLPAMRRIYEEFNFGEILNPGVSPQETADKIRKLIENKDAYTNSLHKAAQKYHYERQTDLVKEIF